MKENELFGSRGRGSRRGGIYIVVMGVAMIVSIIGIASIHIVRLETRNALAVEEMSRAQLAAMSGIEYAVMRLKSDPDWRDNFVSGQWVTHNAEGESWGQMAGTGQFQFRLTDEDGDLSDSITDAVTLRSVGFAGTSSSVLEVALQPTGQGLSSLSASLHSAGDIYAEDPIRTDQTVSSNGNIDVTSSYIYGEPDYAAQAVGTITGSVYNADKKPNMSPALDMPTINTALEYYESRGTHIAYSQVPAGHIQNVVISPGNNPYSTGNTNSEGIYVIDCQGNDLHIRDSRINGTLVLLNAGSGTRLEGDMSWEPAASNLPALLVQGDLRMDWSAPLGLSESSLNINFNPVGSPYEGEADNDQNDSYPGDLKGFVYISGNLDVKQDAKISGILVVGGTVIVNDDLNLNYNIDLYNNAPPGFAAGNAVSIVPGSWKRVSH